MEGLRIKARVTLALAQASEHEWSCLPVKHGKGFAAELLAVTAGEA